MTITLSKVNLYHLSDGCIKPGCLQRSMSQSAMYSYENNTITWLRSQLNPTFMFCMIFFFTSDIQKTWYILIPANKLWTQKQKQKQNKKKNIAKLPTDSIQVRQVDLTKRKRKEKKKEKKRKEKKRKKKHKCYWILVNGTKVEFILLCVKPKSLWCVY